MITETSLTKLLGFYRRAIDSCLFCKSSVEANPSPRCRHSDKHWSYPGSAVGLGQMSGQFRIFTEYLGQLCADLLILFQAGYELHLRQRRRAAVYSSRGLLFGFVGYGLGFAAVPVVALWVLKIPLPPGRAARRCVWMHGQPQWSYRCCSNLIFGDPPQWF